MSDSADQLADAELLGDRLCVNLYRASHAMTAAYRSLLEPMGLTYPQYTVLSALWQRDDATVKELAATLDLDYNTMSPMIKRLETKGLLGRSRNVTDEREVVVQLTEEGRQLRTRSGDVQSEITFATGLDGSERQQLVEQLRNLVDRLQSHAG